MTPSESDPMDPLRDEGGKIPERLQLLAVTSQQLAIIVPSATAVLVLAGNLWYQRWLTQKTLEQQALVTQATLDHERAMKRDERVQDRIAGTYEEMLEMTDWVMEIVRATHPILEPGPEPPSEPDTETVRRVQARIGAHGSPEVKAIIYQEWIPTRNSFFAAASYLTQVRAVESAGRNVKDQFGVTMGEQYQIVQGFREQLDAIIRRLEDRVNAELRA